MKLGEAIVVKKSDMTSNLIEAEFKFGVIINILSPRKKYNYCILWQNARITKHSKSYIKKYFKELNE
jgi:hypothetical protein